MKEAKPVKVDCLISLSRALDNDDFQIFIKKLIHQAQVRSRKLERKNKEMR